MQNMNDTMISTVLHFVCVISGQHHASAVCLEPLPCDTCLLLMAEGLDCCVTVLPKAQAPDLTIP